ncbi:uncharacterized protein [Elaeis guineensis]|uniref:E3 ubiquitin-protein ligase MARCH11 n=1 Tax=Elaeis guineensis var. tenera TaxID=51953 RepID=A0A6I9RXE3_ELAGV|nr:E3 ubiquitin-protein ligase MARCH11 [Elaeis guineensis]XP_010934046.1 E3 ubiquitin-protein ligase MARCH11 [Elaeis guineensis]XP_019709163.1 E3 ubiquitin-protein ligase MARCH11 [Elaeis guineensis]
MPGDEGGGVEHKWGEEGSESNSDMGPDRRGQRGCSGVGSPGRLEDAAVPPPKISIVISQPEEVPNHLKVNVSKSAAAEGDEKIGGVAAPKKGCLPRSESYQEQCRVCQQQTEEPLMDLGCTCRGELAQAHRSCIELWFRTRGSNKCEICQQVAANIPIPESQPTTNYWVWRDDSTSGGGQGERERGRISPLWVAFAILIGGLLLDVLISISLGVSALPVNVIIGVLIVLGLGTAFRLALECCYEWGSRRNVQMVDMTTINPGYHPGM